MTHTATTGAAPQRVRILAAALDLMARHGVDGVSMRQLAAACDLNVASLYHYFPSKADLLRAVIIERNYDALLAVGVPVNRDLPPRERLADLVHQIWRGALAEQPVWRLVVGESLRHDGSALEVVADLVDALKQAVTAWLADGFPELGADPARVASVIAGQVFGYFVEILVVPRPDPEAYLRQRADELAAILFPQP